MWGCPWTWSPDRTRNIWMAEMTYSIFTVSKPLAIVSLCDMVDDQQNPQNQFRWLKQDDVYKCDIYIYFPHLLLDYVHRQPNWNTQLDQLGPLNPKVAGARRDLGGCSIPVSCKYMVRHAAECYPFSIYCEKHLYGYCVCVSSWCAKLNQTSGWGHDPSMRLCPGIHTRRTFSCRWTPQRFTTKHFEV